MMISLDEFLAISRTYNVVPLVKRILADMHTPVSAYLAMKEGRECSFLLESAETNETFGRYSFLGVDPVLLILVREESIEIIKGTTRVEKKQPLLDELADQCAAFRQYPIPGGIGFSGGFLGYLGYGCVRQFETVTLKQKVHRSEPDAMIGLFESVIQFNHRENIIQIVQNVIIDPEQPLDRQYEIGRQKLETIALRLLNSAIAINNFYSPAAVPKYLVEKAMYCQSVDAAKRYIKEGDIFQVVLSRKIELPYSGDPFPVYRALRVINPSPYLFYLDFGEVKLIGSSPEVLVRVHEKTIELFPIAGTRRRGKTEEEDRLIEEHLLNDEKELAEHHMLIDLGRNDVGRVSELGSVHVPVNKRIERYSHVMHIVSEVQGTLQSGHTSLDVLRACFPAGTVTGAPKIRAIEIIDELESSPRGLYAGSVGYIGFNGDLDMCITIRTIIASREKLSIQAGAGIVADSFPENEYRETEAKAQALLDAIALASRKFEFITPLEKERGA
ncbi:MAG: anthranilate synthase component I [bacterium]